MSHADTYDEGGCATQDEVKRDQKKEHPFSVNHWGSHPDADNDDCHTGADFDTLEEAKASDLYKAGAFYIRWIELDGPGIYEVRENPAYSAKECRIQDNLERNEFAMQQGMGLGLAAYNEAMGWDCEEPDHE